jgi:selenide,water dikinase
MLRQTTQLNRVGSVLAEIDGVHAMTDVTGFGLLGHLLEVCRGSGLAADIEMAHVPLIGTAAAFAREGMATGASARNWAGYGAAVTLDTALLPWQQALLTDPQTSGGLLVSCAPDAAEVVLARFGAAGFDDAAVIGRLVPGEPRVRVV